MTDAMQALFEDFLQSRLHALEEDAGYQSAFQSVIEQEQALRGALSPLQRGLLDQYIDARCERDFLELQCVFQGGFTIARELLR